MTAWAALAACWILCWLLTHQYFGLYHDAVLYTLQALNRINPQTYGHDLFFQYGSQDSFTIFTAIYARFIELLGVTRAGIVLVLVFSAGVYVASWFIARRLMPRQLAWLAVGLLIVMPTHYGAYLVFKVDEEFITARLPAVVALLAAIATFLCGRRRWAWLLVLLGGLLHPLMTLPIAAILVILTLPERHVPRALLAAAAAIGLICLVAAVAPIGPIALMDKAWLEIVHLRSNYLFLEHWPARYFERIVLVFSTLALMHSASADTNTRRLIRATGIVCIGGLLATLLTQYVPVVILMQIQPWRALWFATVLAILGIPMLVSSLWRARGTDAAAAVLLVCAWMLQDASYDAALLAVPALGLRWLPQTAKAKYSGYAKALAALVAAVAAAWMLATGFSALSIDLGFHREQAVVERLRTLFGLEAAGMTVVFAAWLLVSRIRLPRVRTAATICVLVVCAPLLVLTASAQWVKPAQRRESTEYFDDWKQLIPPGSEVMWLWDPISTWMQLERPSYLSYAQASGVVFSRQTAMTAARRAENLRPVAPREFTLGAILTHENLPKPLSLESLKAICVDPDLGFVIGSDDIGLHAPRKEWPLHDSFIYLYDCRAIRAGRLP